MKNLALHVKKFLKSEDGPTAVEYAVMLALIVIVCLVSITAIGKNSIIELRLFHETSSPRQCPMLSERIWEFFCN